MTGAVVVVAVGVAVAVIGAVIGAGAVVIVGVATDGRKELDISHIHS